MLWINSNSIWWDDHKLLMVLTPYSTYRANHQQHKCSIQAQLVIIQDDEILGRFITAKNRSAFLYTHVAMLNEVFEEYEIINNDPGPGWRGSIQLSESDWIKLQLMQ